MTHAELAAVFRLMAGQIDNLGAVAQPSVPPIPLPQMQSAVAPQQTGVASAQLDEVKELARQVSGLETLTKPPSPSPAPAAPTQPKPMIDLTTIKGVQQAFNQIRAANYPRLEENGVHDAVMSWALKEFQAATGIPPTGNIDEITLNTIHKAIFGTPRT
jgi:hypothetical protein